MFKRFLRDSRHYAYYCRYSAEATLRSEVAGSYLNWLWWFLDPLLFMLVYTFMVQVIFSQRMENFPIFVFIGLNIWKFFNATVLASASLIRGAKAVLNKVYVPKFVLLASKIAVGGIKMLISFLLVFVMCIIFGIPYTWNMLACIPVFIMLFVITFGIASIVMHLGVYMKDLSNIMTVALKLVYYISGVFFDVIGRMPAPYGDILLYGNPVALTMQSLRQCIMYQTTPNWLALAVWTVIGLLLSWLGLYWSYRYENSYVKVV